MSDMFFMLFIIRIANQIGTSLFAYFLKSEMLTMTSMTKVALLPKTAISDALGFPNSFKQRKCL